eukprot:CAMPEP_0170558082 /NCGR_PEP_ID=MMETSP0211-20121228/32595_1 /TAXON_ID=311385 /ORGANISM="Pseudokeronopsis sp., Strain OXSARD2" /LENGTH=62 /DNA_ID=CAMNT_0010869677 /DNA_START=166 /DNA_END=354 /DNA_ORIENTATION=-
MDEKVSDKIDDGVIGVAHDGVDFVDDVKSEAVVEHDHVKKYGGESEQPGELQEEVFRLFDLG